MVPRRALGGGFAELDQATGIPGVLVRRYDTAVVPYERSDYAHRVLVVARSTRLSDAAPELLRRRANWERVEVTPANLEAYRELARAGILEPFSGFMRGPEAVFCFTQAGRERR